MKSDGGDSIASRLYLYGPDSFEGESLDLFTQILKFDSVNTVLDIGANTGVYSLLAAAADDSIVVHAFEPMPDIHARLVDNIQANSFSNVSAHNLALAENSGELDFYFVPAITVPTGGSAAKAEWPGTEKVVVKALTMDAFCAEAKVGVVDLIKIDTEMTEPSVLRGGINVIDQSKPFIICEVLDDASSSALTELLVPLGYRFFHIGATGLRETKVIAHDPTYQHANYLFVHSARNKNVEALLGI